MKKLDKDKRKMSDYDERESSHNYKRLRTEQQRKANNALDKVLKRKNYNFRIGDDEEYEYL